MSVRFGEAASEAERSVSECLDILAVPGAPRPDEALVRELYAHSSRILDALALRRRVGRADDVASVVCPECRPWGFTESACAVAHQWFIDRVRDAALPEALLRLGAWFEADGWVPFDDAEGSLVLAAARSTERYRAGVAMVPGERRLLVRVISPCTRVDV
ncbi:hypothetical protein I5Q34_00685 [Streptomyces sp. AV19]|uniref:hypothetical protein n=1 Tax=Streptomyces sp. AV19 TaxID=2793068 RepID=UPI0018FEE0A2|nr:hypothetical protein [Streptomyces sp. AV19]MBH1932824.1 hypothetical protein [Streptomyces sp. AV19]MDG4531489.1 hypothetical protein [Streptomyces sp. AV19]